MEQKDIIIVIMFILIIYCIYQINNLKEKFDYAVDSNAGFIQIGNWFIQDRGDSLVFLKGARTDANTKMTLWANNDAGASGQVGLHVPEIQIGDGGIKTWRINTNNAGSLIFNTGNVHKWIDFNANLDMYKDRCIMFNSKWKIFLKNSDLNITYNDSDKLSLKYDNNTRHWKSNGGWDGGV